MFKFALFLALATVNSVFGDVYMHNPRGSNNRLRRNDDNNDVDNANRLFNSQNNDKGGYDVGEVEGERDKMFYYEDSVLNIEWTAQHGCSAQSGPGENTHCEIVLQYMCSDLLRDGATTDTINEDSSEETNFAVGMHEPFDYYDACQNRERNRGLFLADRDVVDPLGDTAEFTRQNNNENRRGFECQEERDYYPYWHPTPWKDIAVLTSLPERCTYYQTESQNVKEKFHCRKPNYAHNNEEDCPAEDWISEPAHGIPAPDCQAPPWSRDNHLGNTDDGYMSSYNWTIPAANENTGQCVLRLRYNISTSDYDGWSVDFSYNFPNSPVNQDPYVDYGWEGQKLSLALNTNQYGRTFQDRSHSFRIEPRTLAIDATCNRIHNLNVRGKRGTIVQTYPAVQYDFTPNRLVIETGDCVHFQWTGSDSNADGLVGEGATRTDRSNICQIETLRDNFCMDISDVDMFDYNTAVKMVHLGQTNCDTLTQLAAEYLEPGATMTDNEEMYQDESNCMKLNAASPYFSELVQFDTAGVFFYMSPRNNVIGRQIQKATLVVEDPNAPVSSS